MAGRTGFTCVRHTLCVINTIMWVSGCAVLGGGIWLRVSYGGYASLLHQYSFISADALCLSAGVMAFILAFCGCCGAWFESRCLLITYFVVVIGVVFMELLGCGLLYAYRDGVSNTLVEELQAGIRRSYNTSEHNPVGFTWDHIQKGFRCCGVEGPDDWFNIAAWPQHRWVPVSCCVHPSVINQSQDIDCGKKEVSLNAWYVKGCYSEVRMWLINRLHLVGIVGLVLAFLQLFGLVASMILFCTLKHKRRSRTYLSYHSDT